MNQQDLVWVRLPFSSLEESKVRPAVIISNDEYNKKCQDVIVCAVTSKLEKPHSVLIDNKNLSSGKLPIKSRIRADKILQIEKNLIIKSFAKLNEKTFDVLVDEILKLIRRN